MIDPEAVTTLYYSICAQAKSVKVDVHPSFGIEMLHYSSRQSLQVLDSQEVIVVLTDIATRALVKQPAELNGLTFQAEALEMCPKVFRMCDGAAYSILVANGMHESAQRVKSAAKTAIESFAGECSV